MNKSDFKQLSYDSVKIATNLFLLSYGEVTTLTVKTFLRSLGFWAEQKEISRYMENFFDEDVTIEIDGKDYEVCVTVETANGFTFRKYFLSEIADEVAEPLVQATTATTDPTVYINGETPQDYVRRNIDLGSFTLSLNLSRHGLNVSPRSVAAIKANINR